MHMTRRNTTGLTFSPFKMLPKAVLAAIVFLLFVQSGGATNSTIVAPSPTLSSTTANNPSSLSTASNGTTSPSMGSASQTGGSGASNALSTNTVTETVTKTVTSIVWGTVTVSPTWAANVTFSASVIPEVEWKDWQKPSDCQKKCCDTGAPVITQTRTCDVRRPRCNLTDCNNYGPTERDISCYTVCSECMPSKGYTMAASGLITITAAIFISAMFVARP